MEIPWRLPLAGIVGLGSASDVGHHGAVATLLVVEDERDIREVLRRYLERAGHGVLTSASGSDALAYLESGAPDLAVLDLGLPDVDGLEVLAVAKSVGVPVIVLTARSAVEDRIRGLQAGADDYVTKPFSPQEVVLRVSAVLGRGGSSSAAPDPIGSFGGGRLRIDISRHEAFSGGRRVELTPTEWGVLVALADTPGRVLSRAELVNRVRGYEFVGYERTIDSHVKNLRRKLGSDGSDIVQTVQGAGYRLGVSRDL